MNKVDRALYDWSDGRPSLPERVDPEVKYGVWESWGEAAYDLITSALIGLCGWAVIGAVAYLAWRRFNG
jgi:hypothetical protein